MELSLLLCFCLMVLCLSKSVFEQSDPSECPIDTFTTCSKDATCCKMVYSYSGYGCCEEEGATCCDGAGVQPTGDPIVSCCPAGYSCVQADTYNSICIPSNPSVPNQTSIQVCTPGPRYSPKNLTMNPGKLPSGIIIGDSVSIGYTPYVIASLKESFYIQHSPWAGGGGADDTGNGVRCLSSYLRTSNSLEHVDWNVITFNFGLHNSKNDSASYETYVEELTNITAELALRNGTSKLMYVLTTPMMVDYHQGNTFVEDHNTQARAIMERFNVPVMDLYKTITDHCGETYTDCDWCKLAPCQYHYNKKGYEAIAKALQEAIDAL